MHENYQQGSCGLLEVTLSLNTFTLVQLMEAITTEIVSQLSLKGINSLHEKHFTNSFIQNYLAAVSGTLTVDPLCLQK